jgi:hypothetical protein
LPQRNPILYRRRDQADGDHFVLGEDEPFSNYDVGDLFGPWIYHHSVNVTDLFAICREHTRTVFEFHSDSPHVTPLSGWGILALPPMYPVDSGDLLCFSPLRVAPFGGF